MAQSPDPQTLRLIAGYDASAMQLQTRTVDGAGRLWQALPVGLDAQAVAQWLQQMIPLIEGAQRSVGALTSSYLAAVGLVSTAQRRPPVGVPMGLMNDAQLRGVRTSEVYLRAVDEARYQSTIGKSLEEAHSIGLDRVQAAAATDLQLAKTHASRYVMNRDPRITGYRRVTHGRCCNLCELAASRVYHKSDLMPIHARCTCGVVPEYGATLEAVQLGPPALEDRGDAVAVHDHGELGPVLAVKGQDFRGPADLQ